MCEYIVSLRLEQLRKDTAHKKTWVPYTSGYTGWFEHNTTTMPLFNNKDNLSWSVPRAKSHVFGSVLHSSGSLQSSTPANPQATPISPDCSWPYPRGHLYRTQSSARNPVRTGSGQSPGLWMTRWPPLVTWTSCDDHATMCHSGLLISRPPLGKPGTWGFQPLFLYIYFCYIVC